MDNITHSLVGLGVGELVHRSIAPEPSDGRQQTRHRLFLVACALASNAPDLDLLLTKLLPDPLGYLLNHRGHTHTLLFAIPQLLMLCGAILLCWPAARALLRDSVRARAGFGLSLLLGLCLHLLMDYLNSYGLHPFAPFDARWFYGDMVFIVEPVFWIAFGVTMAMTIRRRLPKLLWLLALGGALVFFTLQSYLSWSAFGALLAMGALLAWLQGRARSRGRAALLAAVALSVGYVGVQGYASALGRARVELALHGIDPAAQLLDVAMTAFPSNPLCWNFVSVESNEAAGNYRLRRGLVNLAPGSACPAGLVMPPQQPAGMDGADGMGGAVVLVDQETDSLGNLRALNRDSCYVGAWLRFARAPALHDGALSDYRFSTGMGGNFTVMRLEQVARQACPEHVPAWGVPRQDLLTPPPAVAGR